MVMDRIDMAFFARNGYVLVPGVVDAQDCETLIEETWKLLPPHWKPNQPDTWAGTVEDSCHAGSLALRQGHIKFQRKSYPKLDVYERAFGLESRLGHVAKGLIGLPLAPMRHRGLYAIAPCSEREITGNRAHHIESHAAQIVALTYLADVPTGGGGLLVWPGSHRDLYLSMGSKLEYVSTPRFTSAYAAWAEREPIEVAGKRGDAVLIHHRLLHAPSANRSNSIRFGFLCDFQRQDYLELCAQAPGEDMWADWPNLAALEPALTREGPDVQLAERVRPKPRRHSSGRFASVGESVTRKADASKIARARKPGDLWLAVSDSPRGWTDHTLIPRGGQLGSEGLIVRIDGVSVDSVSEHDHITRLPAHAAALHVQVSGSRRPLWLKVLRIELPFEASVVLHHHEIEAGGSLSFEIAGDHAPPRVQPVPAGAAPSSAGRFGSLPAWLKRFSASLGL